MKKWESPYLQSMRRSTNYFRTGLWLTAAALFLCFLLILGRSFFIPSFTIYNKTNGEVVARVPLKEILELRYVYRQSYDRGLIEEYFVIEDKRILPTVMTYDTDSYDFHGSRYKNSDRRLVGNRWHVNIEEHPGYAMISYRIGYTIEQNMRLLTIKGEQSFSFKQMGEPGDLIIVGAGKR